MDKKEVRTLQVAAGEEDGRLDRWFKRRWPHLNHIQIHKLARSGQIRVDGARVKPETRLAVGAQVRVPPLPDAPSRRARQGSPHATRLRPFPGALRGRRGAGAEQAGGPGRAGRHQDHTPHRPAAWRLGRGAGAAPAGAPAGPRHLRRAGAGQDARRPPRASLAPSPSAGPRRPTGPSSPASRSRRQGLIELPLVKKGVGDREMVVPAEPKDYGAEPAETEYVTISRAAHRAAWMALRPHTGRTHQLRAHMKAIGHPILGDPKYGDEASGRPVRGAEAAAARAPAQPAPSWRRHAGDRGAAEPGDESRLRALRLRRGRGRP